ncbi:MAG: DNA topoisomerase I, partial [Chloroflexi bacterium]|nr:DNA topoisomerase I [Chloroflexota bacterium]
MEAYCFKCKTKREIQSPVAGFNAKGSPVTTGVCAVCGTKMYRMGRTPAHEGLEKPAVISSKERKAAKVVKRSGKLVIVESPAKAKTIQRFLGKGYQVKASVGHIRDLLRSTLSVDVDNDFAPKYRVPNEQRNTVKDLQTAVSNAKEVYLATDPDREGEAIAWHLIAAA